MRALQVLGPAVRIPGAGARAQQAALGGDDQVLRVGMERFGDQFLVHVRAVAVGGVEEIHAQLDTPGATRECALARSFGGPQTFGPQTRIAPKPRRLTVRSPTRTVEAMAPV